MFNFFVNASQIKEEKIYISGDDYNHIVNVLRMKQDDKIYVNNKDNSDSYLCNILKIENSEVICEIISKNETNELPVKVYLFQGLPKFEKMETIIQKCVELGVSEITPVDMRFCVAKLNNQKKIERWRTISEVAAKQSKRNIIPKINELISVKKLSDIISNFDLTIVAYENEEKITLKNILNQNKNINTIAIVVGPEGGLHEDEVKCLQDSGAKVASLGKRILRTETAGPSIMSMITYEFEL